MQPEWAGSGAIVWLTTIHNMPPSSTAHFAPVECCFKYAQKRIRHPQSYYETSKDCPKPAVV
uniref:Chemokine interleukin-8-like domain-containing protein n=1 Tax=Ficedula albicollis TaxID=59894 RepID=A0A803VGQ1_FICAL